MKTKPAQSKVLLDAERERKEILAELTQQTRRLRSLERRLKAAGQRAEPLAVIDGEALSVERQFAGTMQIAAQAIEEEIAFLRSETLASSRRAVEREIAEEAARVAPRSPTKAFADELAKVEGGLDALKAIQGARGDGSQSHAQAILAAVEALPADVRRPLEASIPELATLREAIAARAHSPAN